MAELNSAEALTRAWHERDRLYHELFGSHKYSLPKKYEPPADVETGLANTPAELAALAGKSLNEKDINILAYEATPERPYWIFATSGLSNPWFGQSEDVSGFACELVLKTKNPGRWTIKLMRRLIYYLVSYSGTLSPGVSLQFDAPLFSSGGSDLGGIIVWYVDEAPDCVYHLHSGQFGIFSVIGITGDEGEFIETVDQYGCWCIQEILKQAGYDQLTEPARKSMIKDEEFGAKVRSLRNYLENFGFSALSDQQI